jgi:hypothetical protein
MRVCVFLCVWNRICHHQVKGMGGVERGRERENRKSVANVSRMRA